MMRRPPVLGVDVSGVVVERGQDVTAFAEGDEVFAFIDLRRSGGYAEYAAVDVAWLANKPNNLVVGALWGRRYGRRADREGSRRRGGRRVQLLRPSGRYVVVPAAPKHMLASVLSRLGRKRAAFFFASPSGW